MPAAIPIAAQVAAASIVGATGAGVVGSALIYGASTIVAGVVSRELFSSRSQGVDIENIRGNYVRVGHTVPLIYGERMVGGTDVFVGAGTDGEGGKDENFVWIVQAIGEGECDGIATNEEGKPLVYIDKKLWGEEIKADLVKWWFYSGSADQKYNTEINSATRLQKDDKFDDPMKNTCYMIYRLDYDSDNFSGVPERQIVLKGIRVKDVRTGGNGFSRNPVDILYDYVTDRRYGLGWSPGLIDYSSWSETASYCDSLKWEIDYVVASQMKSQDIIDTILSHFRGYLHWNNGLLYLKYVDLKYSGASVMTIEDKHVARDGSGVAMVSAIHPNIFSIPDALTVTYVNKKAFWTADSVVIGDGESVQMRTIEFPGYTDREVALSMASYVIERQRDAITYTLVLRQDTVILEPNDVVDLNCTELAEIDVGEIKQFRVVDTQFRPDGLMSVSVIIDKIQFYDTVFDPDLAVWPGVGTWTDVTREPPPVTNIVVKEVTFDSLTRSGVDLHVSFSPPEKYPAYSHVLASVIFPKDVEPQWSYECSPVDNFIIRNVKRERETIGFRLNTVSVTGAIQTDENAAKKYWDITGVTEDIPPCPTYFDVTVDENNSVVFQSLKLYDRDILEYEVRMGNPGDEWKEGVYVTSFTGRSDAFTSFRHGEHLFMLNTKHINGKYCPEPMYREAFVPIPNAKLFDSIPIDFSDPTSEYDNTYWYDESGQIILRRSSDAKSWGTFTTDVIQLDNEREDQSSIVYLDGTMYVTGTIGSSWEDLTTESTDWDQFSKRDERFLSWEEVAPLEGEQPAVKLEITIEYSKTYDMVGSRIVNNMQRQTAFITGKFLKVKFYLEDFSLSSNITLTDYVLKAMYREQSLLTTY